MNLCKCGCGQPVTGRRSFVDKEHQLQSRSLERDRPVSVCVSAVAGNESAAREFSLVVSTSFDG